MYPSFLNLLPTASNTLIYQVSTENELSSLLHSSFTLAISFIYGSVFTPILVSQFVPLLPFPHRGLQISSLCLCERSSSKNPLEAFNQRTLYSLLHPQRHGVGAHSVTRTTFTTYREHLQPGAPWARDSHALTLSCVFSSNPTQSNRLQWKVFSSSCLLFMALICTILGFFEYMPYLSI